jgi:tetratricopeptide (TPR) repeat protein
MKKQSIKVIALLALVGTLATGCDLLKDLEYTVTPTPLEMHGDSVLVKVEVTFPEKGIHKKAYADIKPILGNTALKSIRVQGEKATGNGEVVAYKVGGKVTYNDILAYTPDMEAADLMITGKVFKGDKEKEEITPTKISDATIITPYLVNKDFKVIIANDEFRRVTEESFTAQLNYSKGQASVSSSEMRQNDIKLYQSFLENAQVDPKIVLKSINITGFASPEGEEDKNNSLSTERAASGKISAMKVAKNANNETATEEIYNEIGSGEDYDGFKNALSADNIMNEDDKNLILRVLETISNPAEREKAMRDMGKTFTYLDKNIFPQLRRTEIVAVYDQTGFSDEELITLSTSNPDTLDLEELLFTASLYTNLNEKLRVYKIAETRYSEDYRTSNNVGVVLYMQNKLSEAKAQFEKANGIQNNVISKNNLGVIAGLEGNRTKSSALLNQAEGAGEEVSYNKGILDIQNGDYSSAILNLGSNSSYNKALAQLLNGNVSTAVTIVNNSDDSETAQGYYLKAVAAARQDKLQNILSNLKNALSKDSSLKSKAAKDREFLKYMENVSFSAIVK